VLGEQCFRIVGSEASRDEVHIHDGSGTTLDETDVSSAAETLDPIGDGGAKEDLDKAEFSSTSYLANPMYPMCKFCKNTGNVFFPVDPSAE
jgi:hypothetical protein